MITTLGKQHIKRYLAGDVAALAGSVAIGIGSSNPALDNKRLDFEVARMPIMLRAYDAVADKIIFKAQIPEDFYGKITEFGLYSLSSDTVTDTFSESISSMDQLDGWVATSGSFLWNSTNARNGLDAMRFALATNTTATAKLDIGLDLSQYSPADSIGVAYNASTNAKTITLTMFTDSSNYYTASFTPTAGYVVNHIPKSSFTATGTPNWSTITSVSITAASTTGGSTVIDIDGIGVFDNDFLNPDLVLIARETFSPISRLQNSINEFEFSLGVTV